MRLSLYYIFIKDWLEVFGPEQFLLLKLEDYSDDRVEGANQISDFLGLGEICRFTNKRISTFHIFEKYIDFYDFFP